MSCVDFLAEIQHKFQKQMVDDFESQNSELFDVVFEIEGKKLYAHKMRLSVISPTFKTMLSNRWMSKDEVIKIQSHKYDDFKNFLTIIYSGECEVNDANILAMIDMAEFYQIDYLKNLFDSYLSKTKLTLENIFELIKISNKYLMAQMKLSIQKFIMRNFTNFVKRDEFLNVEECDIKEIVLLKCDAIKPEDVFQAVYQWCENKARQRQNIVTKSELNDTISDEIAPFLPLIQFKTMHLNFLNTFVAERCFIFSSDELSDILNNARSEVKVKVTNSYGHSITGTLPSYSTAVETIKSLKNIPSNTCKDAYIW